MSDYLSHLAARQLSPGEGVRPRIASYFAPEAQSVAAGAAQPGAPEEVGAERSPTARSPRGPAMPPREPWSAVGQALAAPSVEAVAPAAMQVQRKAADVGLARAPASPPSPDVPHTTPTEARPPAARTEGGLEAPASERSTGPLGSSTGPLGSSTGPLGSSTGARPRTSTAEPGRALPDRSAVPSTGPRGRAESLALEAPSEAGATRPGHPLPEARSRGAASLATSPDGRPLGPLPAAVSRGAESTSTAFARGSVRPHAAALAGEPGAEPLSLEGSRVPAARSGVPEVHGATSAVGRSRALAEALGADVMAPPSSTFSGPEAREAVAVRPPSPSPGASDAGGAAGPVIQVTIGRIEVRAVTPPAPRPARSGPAQPSPAPSLDEYLKRRNGGER